jgi:protein-L-isoaspartate(D-aspartate) O-methyltransferase
MAEKNHFRDQRETMLEQQLRARGIYDQRVLDALRAIPRHEFVPPDMRHQAYKDCPLPIGKKQTISQPYIVAYMTQLLQLKGYERVLEIGTGSGYQTAVLCSLVQMVYSLERFPSLADRAGETLERLGYDNVEIHLGDGSQGLADMAPFDAIIVTAAAPDMPGPLCAQLSAKGGRMVIPVGTMEEQSLMYAVKNGASVETRSMGSVRFVPLIGRYGFNPGARV